MQHTAAKASEVMLQAFSVPLSLRIAILIVSFAGAAGTSAEAGASFDADALDGAEAPGEPEGVFVPQAKRDSAMMQHRRIARAFFNDLLISFSPLFFS
jgi:hypothetical protein